MKRFISISLLLCATAIRSVGCMWWPTHNYYLFSVLEPQSFQTYANTTCENNWRAYGGSQLESGYYYDNVVKVARQKGDLLMVSYVDNLEKYLKCCNAIRYSWDYPTKEEIAQRNQTLRSVKAYAQSKLKTRLRSQHALLLMRCNMLLGLQAENIAFWEQTASQYIETVYKDMMKNIYAGALLAANRKAEAVAIYAEQNDYESLYTCYYKGRSAAAITREYNSNPNSPVLPFLLEDFANNAQEAYDAEHELGSDGKLFIRNISHAEAMQMRRLAQQVVKEGKTDNPALWKSVEAWMTWLFGDRNESIAMIKEAVAMEGTAQAKDNARVLQLYFRAEHGTPGTAYDRQLVQDLQWLEQRAEETGDSLRGKPLWGSSNRYVHVYDRLIHQVLVDKYDRAGRSEIATAFLASYEATGYSSEYVHRLDQQPIEKVQAYADYVEAAPLTPLNQWLHPRIPQGRVFMVELLGTKYLRKAQWDKAIACLQAVPMDFVNNQAIASYMSVRDYKIEPWMKSQRQLDNEEKPNMKNSQKLAFAREMKQLEAGFSLLKGEARAQRAYQLAVMNYQACIHGDAWYLTRYGKSWSDTIRNDEVDWLKRAADLLDISAQSTNFQMKEKSLYAKAFLPGEPWQTSEWNSKINDFETKLHPATRQYRALSVLANFQKENATRTSRYVSHCDVLKEFMKQR